MAIIGKTTTDRIDLRLQLGHSHAVTAVAFSPDGIMLATGSGDRTIKLWDPATGRLLDTLTGHQAHVVALSFSTDGGLLAAACAGHKLVVWELATKTIAWELSGQTNLTSVAFMHVRELLAIATAVSKG